MSYVTSFQAVHYYGNDYRPFTNSDSGLEVDPRSANRIRGKQDDFDRGAFQCTNDSCVPNRATTNTLVIGRNKDLKVPAKCLPQVFFEANGSFFLFSDVAYEYVDLSLRHSVATIVRWLFIGPAVGLEETTPRMIERYTIKFGPAVSQKELERALHESGEAPTHTNLIKMKARIEIVADFEDLKKIDAFIKEIGK
jgi:hypothetical protein